MPLISFVLNTPWTIIGIFCAAISIPTGLSYSMSSLTVIFTVHSFWWYTWLPRQKGARGMALGNIILLGPNRLQGDIEHELVHIRQYQRAPLIHPLLNLVETIRKGYRNNEYEDEAYRIAGNPYFGESNTREP